MTATWVDLIRHGEPQGGKRFRGWRDELLSKTGWTQMRAAVSADDEWDVIVTSPLKRCRDFAEWFAQERNLPLQVMPGFKEVSFGDWEGRTADAIEAEEPGAVSRFWNDPIHNTPPNGEPFAKFDARIGEAWRTLLAEQAGKHVLLVCHGGVVRSLLARVTGIPLERSFATIVAGFACRSRIRVDNDAHGQFTALVGHGAPTGQLEG